MQKIIQNQNKLYRVYELYIYECGKIENILDTAKARKLKSLGTWPEEEIGLLSAKSFCKDKLKEQEGLEDPGQHG